MLELNNRSDDKKGTLYYDYVFDPSCAEDFESIFIKAMTENKPLVCRRYGRLGKSPATQTVLGFLEHQVGAGKAAAHCHVQGEGERKIPVEELLEEFRKPPHLRKYIANVLGFSYVNDVSLIQNIKPIDVLVKYDLLRLVATKCDDFHEDRTNPKVASDCGFTALSSEGSYTNFHPDTMGTYAVMERGGSKQWVFVPPTQKNMEVREGWVESDGLGVFEDCFGIDMQEEDFLYVPCGWNHAVATLKDSLMHGGHLILPETAPPNLDATILQLKYDGLTNDPPQIVYGFLKELISVMIV